MNTDTNAPAYADVEQSHNLTAHERTELDAAAKESPGTEAADAAAAEKAAADAATQTALDAAKATDATIAAATAQAKADQDAAAVAAAQPKPVELVKVPDAPRDWDKERASLRQQYDDGDLSAEELDAARDKLSDERAAWIAEKTLAERENAERTSRAEAAANQSFENAAVAWAKTNAEFNSNPLRHEAMQKAIAAVDVQTGGKLAPADLIKQAEKIAFDAFGWKPAPDTEAARAAALKARQGKHDLPTNLGGAPAAGAERGGSDWADLDAGVVTNMENAIAHMSPAQLDKFLLEVDPG